MSLVMAVPYAGEEHQVGGCPQGPDVQLPINVSEEGVILDVTRIFRTCFVIGVLGILVLYFFFAREAIERNQDRGRNAGERAEHGRRSEEWHAQTKRRSEPKA